MQLPKDFQREKQREEKKKKKRVRTKEQKHHKRKNYEWPRFDARSEEDEAVLLLLATEGLEPQGVDAAAARVAKAGANDAE